MSESTAGVVLIYPSLLGTYGDGGNARILCERLRWRGHDARVVEVPLGEPLPRNADVYVLGGGEDTAQTLAVSHLTDDGGLHAAAEAGKPVFAVCAGFQILGTTFLDGRGLDHPGLGLVDCRTQRLPGPRAVGELVAAAAARRRPADRLREPRRADHARPGRAGAGPGGDGDGNGDGTEGAVQGSVVCTYAHGPALARNPGLADYVLSLAVGELAPLDDREEHELRRERLASVRRSKAAFWRRQWRPPASG